MSWLSLGKMAKIYEDVSLHHHPISKHSCTRVPADVAVRILLTIILELRMILQGNRRRVNVNVLDNSILLDIFLTMLCLQHFIKSLVCFWLLRALMGKQLVGDIIDASLVSTWVDKPLVIVVGQTLTGASTEKKYYIFDASLVSTWVD